MKFVIEGEPLAQQRARTAKNVFYDPQFQAKQNFAWLVKSQMQEKKITKIATPIILKAEFNMTIPKSLSNKKRLSLIDQPHTKKKDVDNLCKFLMDSLNNILWEDDSLIWNLQAKKIYSTTPATIFDIEYV